jgi:hypothetical protein
MNLIGLLTPLHALSSASGVGLRSRLIECRAANNSWQEGSFRYSWDSWPLCSDSLQAHFIRPSFVAPGQTRSPRPDGWVGRFLLSWESSSYCRVSRIYGTINKAPARTFPVMRLIGPYYGLFARHRAEWLVSWACEVFGAILRKANLRVRNVAANSLGAEC